MGLTVAELEREVVSHGTGQARLLAEIVDARGTAGTLGARLDVALNPDGTPRTPVATVSFVTEIAPIIAYPPAGEYVALEGDLTAVYVAKRRLRINGALLPYVTSSTYDAAGDYTIVNFSTPVGNPITSVEYSFDPAAMPPLHYSGNPDIERVVSGLDDFAIKHFSNAQYKSLLDDILARVTIASLVSVEDGFGVDLVGRAFKYVDTIDDLRTLTPTDAPVYVQGHTTVDDGGQGTFRWDAASIVADDNGITIAVAGVATGRWVRQFDGYITPGMLGAAGDGVTNDSVAVQACIGYAIDNSIEIRLLSKTYLIGDIDILPADPLPGMFSSGVTFNGGSDNSDWVAANTLGGSIFRAAPGSTYMFKIGDRDTSKSMGRTIFKNLTMDGVDRTRGGAILHSNGYATKLENVHITHFDYGFVPVLCDRLNMDKVYFTDNKYGLYVDTSIHGTDINSSGNSLKDVHHRKNDYNMYFVADASDFQYNIRGGYWSGSSKGDFVITGCMTALVLNGVNLENPTDGSSLTKPAVFTVGQVSAGSHTGIRLLAIENCLIRDNNTVSGNIPVLMKIVDSLNTSKPSIHRLVIRDSIVLNYTKGLVVDSVTGAEVTASHIGKGIWDSNHCPVAVPPLKSTIWNFTQEASSIGNGNPEAYGVRQYSCPTFMPTLNRTASLTTRTAEVGGLYTNEGATGAVTFTLDNAPIGSEYTFTCIEHGRLIRVTPYTGTQLIGSSGIDKYMDLSTTVGSSVTVTRVSLTSAKSWAVRINSGSVTFAS